MNITPFFCFFFASLISLLSVFALVTDWDESTVLVRPNNLFCVLILDRIDICLPNILVLVQNCL
jgi:hypothetical protein